MSLSMTPNSIAKRRIGQHLYFPIGCVLVALTAFGLLYIRAPEALPSFGGILFPYARAIIVILTFLIVAHFILSILIRMIRFKTASEDEKRAWYKSYFTQMPWLNIVAAAFGVILTSTSFTTHKGAAIGAEGYGYDALFIAWDRAIFGGTDPWVYTHWLFSSPALTKWIDFLYHPAFLPMLIGYLLCVSARGAAALRQTYMLSYLLGWVVIGMIAAEAMHSAGPVFDGVLYGDGATFAPLMDRLQEQLDAGGGPQTADPIRQYLIDLHLSDGINMGAGISAMPSMHIVLAALWVFPAWHVNKFLGTLMTLYGLIIWVGSVHLGWHYFVDGLVGLTLIGMIWVGVGYLVGLYGQPQVTRATT